MSKTAKKTHKKSHKGRARTFRAPRSGVVLVAGNPGNSGGKKGRSGRPPKAFTHWARALYADPRVRRTAERILRNAKHKHYASMFKTLLGYAEGLPKQPVEVESERPLLILGDLRGSAPE